MSIYYKIVLFALIMKHCETTGSFVSSCVGNCLFQKEQIPIDEYDYEGDPIEIACIYNHRQWDFHEIKIVGSGYKSLIKNLNNNRGLTLFFNGINNGTIFRFFKDWFDVSNNNICVISYAYNAMPEGVMDIFDQINRLVKERRFEFIAKVASDLILNVRNLCLNSRNEKCLRNMEQVDMVGFSMGAHLASLAAQYIERKTNETIRMLLGLDPARVSYYLDSSMYFKKGHALYTQAIHTSIMGTPSKVADIDIYLNVNVKVSFCEKFKKHALAVLLHAVTATKKLYLIAERKGNSEIIENNGQPIRELKPTECLVGIYGTFDENKKGKRYIITLENQDKIKYLFDRLKL